MVDIQSVAAEIRRGKKKIEGRKKETTGQKYNGPLLHRAAIITAAVFYRPDALPVAKPTASKQLKKFKPLAPTR